MSKCSLNDRYVVEGRVLGVNFTNKVYTKDSQTIEEIIGCVVYTYAEGNYSCDCNKVAFAGLDNEEGEPSPCGENIRYEELLLVDKITGLSCDLLPKVNNY